MLGGAVVGDKSVFALLIDWHWIEIEIKDEGAGPAIDVHAVIFDAKRLVEQARRCLVGTACVEEGRIFNRFSKCLDERDHEILLWTPKVLRTKLHDLGDAVECPLQ